MTQAILETAFLHCSVMLQSQEILHGRYRLQERLGRTATGRQTWLAIDLRKKPHKQVIVKLLAFNPEMQWDEFKLFEREAQVLQALDHSRIPKYRDYFSIDDRVLWFGLVQQYIPGESFQDLLDRGETLSEKEARRLAAQVLSILAYLHQQDPPVLHRDIKPSNLIRGKDGCTYLVDFGAVQDRMAITGVTFTVVGTCGYAPLEQFWGRSVPASDLYALGATLVHLLTGIPPADLPQQNARMMFRDRLSLDPSFADWLETLTESAVEKRFASAQNALTALKSRKVSALVKDNRRKLTKPDRSRVQLRKSPGTLEIYIPPLQGWKCLLRLAQIIVFGGFFITLLLPSIMTLPPAIGSLFIVGIIALVICLVIFVLSTETKVVFGRTTFNLIRHSGNFIWLQRGEAIANILGVFLERKDASTRVVIRGDRWQTHEFGSDLSEAECLWLAQEIQDWLR